MALKGIKTLFTGVTITNNAYTSIGFVPNTLGASKILITVYGGAGTTTPNIDAIQVKGSLDGVNGDGAGGATYTSGALTLTGKNATRGVENHVVTPTAIPALFPCPFTSLQIVFHTTNATNNITGATVEVIAYFDASRDFTTNEIN